MKAWQLQNNFGLENLNLVETKTRPLGPNDVLVRVKACSLNFRDLMVVKGQYNPKLRFPLVPVSDGAGEVMAVGADVTDFAVNDKVAGIFSQEWMFGTSSPHMTSTTLGDPLDGMLTEQVVLKSHGLVKVPKYLSFAEAACLPCAGVTAFNAMFCQANLTMGDTILIEGTGGVSLFALQFAKVMGLKSIVLSSSNDKLGRARELGATHTINYVEHPQWHKEVLSVTEGLGVDAVIEVGGGETINQAISCVKPGGTILVIGILTGIETRMNLIPVLMKNIRLQGIFVGAKSVFTSLNRMLEHSKIHPVIDRSFTFDEAKSAFTHLESQKHFGKVVITM
jgi:NADPH:quinone reductase-like Zn-dependent oxidoreductase